MLCGAHNSSECNEEMFSIENPECPMRMLCGGTTVLNKVRKGFRIKLGT